MPSGFQRADDFWDEDERRDFAAMATRLAALRDDDVAACFGEAQSMFLRPRQRADGDVVRAAHVDHFLRRLAKRVHDHLDGVVEGDTEQLHRLFGPERWRRVIAAGPGMFTGAFDTV